MEVHLSLQKIFFSISASIILFLLATAYAPSARAAVSEEYQSNKPITLAWYYGPRRGGYYHGWYRNGWYGNRCGKVCNRNRWGYVQCYRTC